MKARPFVPVTLALMALALLTSTTRATDPVARTAGPESRSTDRETRSADAETRGTDPGARSVDPEEARSVAPDARAADRETRTEAPAPRVAASRARTAATSTRTAEAAPAPDILAIAREKLPRRLRLEPPPPDARIALDAALTEALAHYPGIVAGKARVDMARGEYRQRSAANNPTLSFGGGLLPRFRPEVDSPNARDFPNRDVTYVSYVFPTSGSRTHQTRAASSRFQAAGSDFETAKLDLVQAVTLAYVDLQAIQELIREQEATYLVAVNLTSLARHQFEAGAVAESNVFRAQLEEARAEQDLARSHAGIVLNMRALGFQLARPPSGVLWASDPLEMRVPVDPVEELVRLATVRRPEVSSARASVRALQEAIEVQRARRRPDLTVQSTFSDISSNSGGDPYMAWVQLPLWDRGQIGGAVAQARAELIVGRANLDLAIGQVGLDVGRAYAQVDAARAVLEIVRTRTLPQSRKLLSQATVNYIAGATPLFDLLDAQRVLRQAMQDELSARAELARALAALERAAGGRVPTRTEDGGPRDGAPSGD